MSEVDELIAHWGKDAEILIEILHEIQARHNYLPPELLEELAPKLDVPKSVVYSVATFYNAFSVEPRGRHCIGVCTGTPCHVKGAPSIVRAIARHLGCKVGETDKTGTFTLLTTGCVGTCGLAPVVVIDDEMYGNVTQTSIQRLLKKYPAGEAPEPAVAAKAAAEDTE